MANQGKALDDEVVRFVEQFPATIIARVRRKDDGGYIAVVDCGPQSFVSDADMPEYGSTAQQACDRLKAHLLDDLRCMGLFGKRQYQPHWDGYDIKYRLGEHWTGKQLQALEAPIPPEARPSTEIVCTTTSFGRCSYEKIDA